MAWCSSPPRAVTRAARTTRLATNYSFDKVDRADSAADATSLRASRRCRPRSAPVPAAVSPAPRSARRFRDGTPTYNHFDEIFDTGHTSDNILSASGGNDKTMFYLSAGYTDQQRHHRRSERRLQAPNGSSEGDAPPLRSPHRRRQLLVRRWPRQLHPEGIERLRSDARRACARRRRSTTRPYLDTRDQDAAVVSLSAAGGVRQHRGSRLRQSVLRHLPGSEHGRDQSRVRKPEPELDADRLAKIDYTLGADYYNNQLLDALAQSSSSVLDG